MNYKEKTLFIGGGYIESQLFSIIPFADGYSKEKNITKWIFEKELSLDISDHENIKKILAKYKIQFLERSNTRIRQKFRNIKSLLIYDKMLLKSLCLALKSCETSLSGHDDWYQSQLIHGVIDSSRNDNKDGRISIPFWSKLISAFRVISSVSITKSLLRSDDIVSAILVHNVYRFRGVVAEFNKAGVDIVQFIGSCFYRLNENNNFDSFFIASNMRSINSILKVCDIFYNEDFWISRSLGASNYDDAKAASKGRVKLTSSTPKNLIFMHVFRDSPFSFIDKERIFFDYADWMLYTLKCLRQSNENWLIKIHPSSERWGEDQHVWLKALINSVYGINLPGNIEVCDGKYSNIDLFAHAKRLITYSGTSHLEISAWGVKPIIISNAILSQFGSNNVLKPKTREGYLALLLLPNDSSIFKQSSDISLLSKKLLYFQEELFNLSSETGSISIYRGDSPERLRKNFHSISCNFQFFSSSRERFGKLVASGLPHTTSMKIFDIWYDFYKNSESINLTDSSMNDNTF